MKVMGKDFPLFLRGSKISWLPKKPTVGRPLVPSAELA